MSDQKLSLSHKLIAALERWVRMLVIHDFPTTWPCVLHSLPASIPVACRSLPLQIDTATRNSDCTTIPVAIIASALQQLQPVVHDTMTSHWQINVHEAPLAMFLTCTVGALNPEFSTRVLDSAQVISGPLAFAPRIAVLAQTFGSFAAKINSMHTTIPVTIKENTWHMRQLTVRKSAIDIQFLSRQEQLEFWKRAVWQSQKEPKQLNLIGIYFGVPIAAIERMRIDSQSKKLNYNINATYQNPDVELKDIAIFSDDVHKQIVVAI